MHSSSSRSQGDITRLDDLLHGKGTGDLWRPGVLVRGSPAAL
jgi:hypothetical protein